MSPTRHPSLLPSPARVPTPVPTSVPTPVPSLASTLAGRPAGRLFATFWGSLVTVDVTRPAGVPVGLGALAALVACCSLRQRGLVPVGLAVVAWLVATGFLLDGSGALVLHGPADAVRLLGLVTVALGAAHLPHRGRR